MNKVFIIGNLTRDPEVRTSSTGNAYVTFGVAVNIRGNSGQQDTNFYSVRMFRQIETMQRFLAKGKKVAVVGSLSLRIYESNDGQKRIAADVMADDIEFLSPSPNQGGDGQGNYGGQNNNNYAPRPAEPFGQMNPPANESGFSQVDDDDLPF